MPELVFAIPGDPYQRTGGYLYDRRLSEALTCFGWTIRPLRLSDEFPQPSPDALDEADLLFGRIPDRQLVLVDGLAFSAMPEVMANHAARLPFVALVHHPLGYETGLPDKCADFLVSQEREALRHARGVLVTSTTTFRTLLNDFGVPADRMRAAMPGTDEAPIAVGSNTDTIALLAVGSVLPRKDFAGLVAALAPSSGLPWTLTIAGSTKRDPTEVRRLRDEIDRHGLGERVVLAGELETSFLAKLLDRTDLFVSSSRYEGFGMALSEAVARGLPIVAVAGGAVADWMDPEATLLVPPEDPPALQQALGQALSNPDLRARLRRAALVARERLPTWSDCARQADALLRSLLPA